MANVEVKHETVLDAGTTKSRLARVYAEALLASAQQVSPAAPTELAAELTAFVDAVGADATVANMLVSPVVGKKVRAAALETALSDRASRTLRGLIATLQQNNRLALLRPVAAAYRRLIAEQAGQVPVKITAAVPLTDDQMAKLTENLKKLLKQDPVLNVRVDPDLLGGLVVQVGDSVVDTSVRTRLQTLRTLLLDKGGSHGN
ncbi:ATP synthase subunit delta [Gemmata obscuriglobus]|uniref:ATP synthase subunit delta n=1 Tax=Gemmata obscuriglobus TaxID=114 RepID=A0A2Z3H5T5_9BACT|nr:ATP synthase F1 subunit delta [Gemmata obscuriglobus]AWM39682.1 F0F1 ATP synthase subunit delta [Gemmata obscuriglobus]QEG27210.1 ATP synthase subunit delta [Gemmata obscuriglobus]VTS03929.1 f0f1 atp synthase subunit delta : ATP synthase subunit delta OS=Planctomyces brasiliensis (strain ATCC 49424 / DSM 5305 / JCM 21570 / NBRC 103401 / IFAM 1448) GN=atpH PE=3 SV=1: OSCP [Gemmata obscuriglobus UQM 2246]